jgi:hypothetical protein
VIDAPFYEESAGGWRSHELRQNVRWKRKGKVRREGGVGPEWGPGTGISTAADEIECLGLLASL